MEHRHAQGTSRAGPSSVGAMTTGDDASPGSTTTDRGLRPAPDAVIVVGGLAALAGYLLPWFRISDSYDWWFSGWEYAALSSGGGWTLITIGWLVLAIGAGGWARAEPAAAMTALVTGVAGLVFALAVVAVSLGAMPDRDSLNWVGQMPFGIGLPLMAVGFGLLLAASARAIAANPGRR